MEPPTVTDEYIRPAVIPSDGRPRQLEAGWFVCYLVRARDANAAVIQAKIKSKIAGQQWTDVASANEQTADEDGPLWTVELQIEPPASLGMDR